MALKLPLVGAIQIPVPGADPGTVDSKVEEADGDIFSISPDANPAQQFATRALLEEANTTVTDTICGPTNTGAGSMGAGGGTGGTSAGSTGSGPAGTGGAGTGVDSGGTGGPGTGPGTGTGPVPGGGLGILVTLVRAVRIQVQILLLFLKTPSSITMLAHTPNADTSLLPAIDCINKYAGVILNADPRIANKVDLEKLAAQGRLLLQLRELLKIFSVGAYCIEAGITHVEQYLDACARFIYGKLVEALGEDILLQKDLQPLLNLVSLPIQIAQATKKSNAKTGKANTPGTTTTTTPHGAGGTAHGAGGTLPGGPLPVTGGVPPGVGGTTVTIQGPSGLPVAQPPLHPIPPPRTKKPPRAGAPVSRNRRLSKQTR